MNTVTDKLLGALRTAGVSDSLHTRFGSTRIGVWTPDGTGTPAGLLLAEALGDQLGRLWRNLHVAGPLAARLLSAAELAAHGTGLPHSYAECWSAPYDMIISIGGMPAVHSTCPIVNIGANGWTAFVGPNAILGENSNPVGPAAAAALASAAAFAQVFADSLPDAPPREPSFIWSVWQGPGDGPAVTPLHLPDTTVFGVGAVTHGFLWPLQRWPQQVRGRMALVDPDPFDASNAQRYAGMTPDDIGVEKAITVQYRLQARYPDLDVTGYDTDMNTYCAKQGGYNLPLAIAGLDSPEARRQLAVKLPARVVNMWTEHRGLGAARYGFGDGWRCLWCSYGDNHVQAPDEALVIHRELGLAPARARYLLDSGAGMTADDAAILSPRGIDMSRVIGRPLRSVRAQLCATGQVMASGGQTEDVPLPFSSLLAGLVGFAELVAEVCGTRSCPGRWQMADVLASPLPGHWFPIGPQPDCWLCSDATTTAVINNKYI